MIARTDSPTSPETSIEAPTLSGRRASDVATVVVFVVGSLVPCWGMLRHADDAMIQATEQRRAAPPPRFELSQVGGVLQVPTSRTMKHFPREFEAWFNDCLAGRRRLIHTHNLALVWGLTPRAMAHSHHADAPKHPVLIGREGWLFYNQDNLYEDFRCTRPFSTAEVDEWCAVLEARRAWLARRGIHYLLVVAPNQQTIYGRYMPRAMTRVGSASRLDQLYDALRKRSDVTFVDLREPLRNAAGPWITYNKTDTHWNDYGAFVAYGEMGRVIRSWLPSFRPKSIDEFDVTVRDAEGQYLATLVDSPVPFREELVEFKRKRPSNVVAEAASADARGEQRWSTSCETGELESAVLLHDSFFPYLGPMLDDHWRRTRHVWTDGFPVDEIEATRPQVVVQEFVERKLMRVRPQNPPELSAETDAIYTATREGALRR